MLLWKIQHSICCMQIPPYIFLLRPPSALKPTELLPEECCLRFAQYSFNLIRFSIWDTQVWKQTSWQVLLDYLLLGEETPTHQQQWFFLQRHHSNRCVSLTAKACFCVYIFLCVTQPPSVRSVDLLKFIHCSLCCHLKVIIQCVGCLRHCELQLLFT